MTWQRLRPAASGLFVVLAILTGGIWPRAARAQPTNRSLQAAFAPGSDGRTALPAGFAAAVDLATSQRFVRVVADDIDSDGDLDVVASVGTLDLLVWENDGAGHFSRRPSSSHQALQAQPPAPAFDDGSLAVNEWIQNDHDRGARTEPRSGHADEGPETALSAPVRTATGRYGPRLRSPRAPPLPLTL